MDNCVRYADRRDDHTCVIFGARLCSHGIRMSARTKAAAMDVPGSGVRRFYLARICGVAALGGLLFGYDTAVINGAIGFLQKYFELSATMTGWVTSSALAGCAVGVLFTGAICDRYGRKSALVAAGALFLISAIGTALPRTVEQLVLFRILAGTGVGIASMAAPLYIAEVAPARMRGRLVSINQLAIISGMLLIFFVNYLIASRGDASWQIASSWRWMFASGILPALLFLILLTSTPESPRWLVHRGRVEQATTILRTIGGEEFARGELAEIRAATDSERAGARPAGRRLTGIVALGILLAVLQQVTGINVFLYFGTEIFRKLGSAVDTALLETIAVGTVNLLFTIVAIATVDRVGRKPLMIAGAGGMGLCLAGMGASAQAGVAAWWMLVLVLGYIACFAVSVGPVTWVLLTEIFPAAVRGRALAFATLALWSANFVVSQTFPMLDANPWLLARFHHAFPFYLYSAMCLVLVATVWGFVPETKGRSLEEIEAGWSRAEPSFDTRRRS